MSNYWDNSPEEEVFDKETIDEAGTYIRVNGSTLDVQPGANFISTVKEAAKNAGLGKFRVFINGLETMPSDAPETFEEGDVVELRKYDVAG